jgi:hypothetical protein
VIQGVEQDRYTLLGDLLRPVSARDSKERKSIMLIVNDTHRLLAGVVSLNEPCLYCSQPLRAYPLIMSDDAAQTVYHATCALELATDILVDLYTVFSPPAPFQPFFVLRTPDVAAPQQAAEEDG